MLGVSCHQATGLVTAFSYKKIRTEKPGWLGGTGSVGAHINCSEGEKKQKKHKKGGEKPRRLKGFMSCHGICPMVFVFIILFLWAFPMVFPMSGFFCSNGFFGFYSKRNMIVTWNVAGSDNVFCSGNNGMTMGRP